MIIETSASAPCNIFCYAEHLFKHLFNALTKKFVTYFSHHKPLISTPLIVGEKNLQRPRLIINEFTFTNLFHSRN